MNPLSNFIILALLFLQILSPAVLAESKENTQAHTIPVVEKSLQPDTNSLKPVINNPQSEAKSFPLKNENSENPQTAAVNPVNSEAKKDTSSKWLQAKENADQAWQETKKTSQNAWDKTKQGSGKAWDSTKETSVEVWKTTKDGSKKVWVETKKASSSAWEATKEGSKEAWKATKSAVHEGADYVSEKTKD
jgi:hypothetical protein